MPESPRRVRGATLRWLASRRRYWEPEKGYPEI